MFLNVIETLNMLLQFQGFPNLVLQQTNEIDKKTCMKAGYRTKHNIVIQNRKNKHFFTNNHDKNKMHLY